MKNSIQYQNELLKENEKILMLLGVLIFLIIFVVVLVIFTEKKNVKDKKSESLYFENISEVKEVGKLKKIEEKENNIYIKVDYPEIGEEKVDKLINELINNKINKVKNDYKKDNMTYYYFVNYEVYIGNGNILSLVIKDRVDNRDLKNMYNNKEVYYYDLNNSKELKNSDIFKDDYKEKIESILNININDDTDFVFKKDKIVFVDLNKDININDIKDYIKIDVSEDKDYSNQIKEKTDTILNKAMQVNQDVVMYDKDSRDGNIIATIKKDTILNVHSNLSNGYSMIFYNDGIGYVETKYLIEVTKKEIGNVGDIVSTDRITLYVIDNVTLRSAPSTNSSKVGKLQYGDKVIQTGYVGEWIRIDYNGVDAYLKKNCISVNEVVRKTINVDVPAQKDIDSSKPMVALTFDDGPNNTSTVRILDTLEKYNARATFFDLGKLVLRYPDVVKREAQLGEVGTHSYSHQNLNTLTLQQVEEDLRLAKEAHKQVLGEYPKLIRPPYGNANGTVKQAITDMALVNWNVDSLDWKYRNKDLTLNEIDKYGDLDGKIILLHSIHAATADTVELLVPDLLSKGYQLVTVSELAKYRDYTLQTGVVYYGFK